MAETDDGHTRLALAPLAGLLGFRYHFLASHTRAKEAVFTVFPRYHHRCLGCLGGGGRKLR